MECCVHGGCLDFKTLHCYSALDLQYLHSMKNNFVKCSLVSKSDMLYFLLLGVSLSIFDCREGLQDSLLVHVAARVLHNGPHHEHEARVQATHLIVCSSM